MKLMSEHQYYLTDGFGTSLFYALDSGMEVSVEMQIGFELSLGANGIRTRVDSELQLKKNVLKYLEIYLSNTLGRYCAPNEYVNISNEWLGKDCFRSPEDLRSIIDYRSGIYPDIDERVW